MDTQTKIIEIVSRVAGKPVNTAADESLFQSGVLDSFTLADLVSALEQEFGVKIPDADLTPRKFDSIERIEAYLASRS
ncbi:MAG TPA: acyl carrier protein [Verrucomicrobiae bacterium]|nr:acyl carrier protein [Verrucomicrobiae bacterium]